MKTIRVTLTCLTDLHTGGQSHGSLLDFLKTMNGDAYLPATHVKGVMRSEAERLVRAVHNIPCAITGMAGTDNHGIILCPELRDHGEYRCAVCSLFGPPNVAGGKTFKEGKIRVMNFMIDKKMGIPGFRTHVSIDRDKGHARQKALYSMTAVPRGTVFYGDIIIREPLTGEEEQLLYASIYSMADYGLGRERSRGMGSMRCTIVPLDTGESVYPGGGP